jgi:cytochrome b561
MQPIDSIATRYDNKTIIFHWVVAILVATQWLGAQVIDLFPKGPLRVDARSLHITCGVLLAVILIGRVVWRLTAGRRLPPVGEGIIPLIAKLTHWALYVLLAAMLVVGLFLTWTRGDNIFNLFSIPAYAPGNDTLPDQVLEIHETIGTLILILAGLHAAAALVHHYFWHDGVLRRMLTRG